MKSVERWLEEVVIGLNLCPFAASEVRNFRLRLIESKAQTERELLEDLVCELQALIARPEIETTLLVHPNVLTLFAEYNQFLDRAEAVLEQMGLTGIFQLASFHPDYQFAGTQPDAAENYTNRSPYPLLHILREASLDKAIERHADTAAIPARNIELMKQMGVAEMRGRLRALRNE